jgi:uncharacterized protein
MTAADAATSAEPAFFEQTWDLSYRHALGETVGAFLTALGDKRLLGRACPKCGRVLFPARSFCDRCHVSTSDWAEVQPHGKLEMFTIVYEPFRGMRMPPPYVLAYVTLDGADTAALGYLKGLDLADAAAAAERLSGRPPIDVKFVDEPRREVTDFWFELAKA